MTLINQPFVVNTMIEACEWLSKNTTFKQWSPESILDIVFRLHDPHVNGYDKAFYEKRNPYAPGKDRGMSERSEQYNTSGYLSAYISGVKFFNYKFMNSEEFVRIKPVFWRFFPLHHNNIGDLLASGVTAVNCASYDFDGEGFVAIEPENHYTPMAGIAKEGIQAKIIKITDAPMLSPKVTINMVRINGQNLILLRKAIMWASSINPGFTPGKNNEIEFTTVDRTLSINDAIYVKENTDTENLDSKVSNKEETPLLLKGETKKIIMLMFDELHFTKEQWKKYLGDPPFWLKECRISQGSKKASSMWNPVLIGCALIEKNIPLYKLDHVFARKKDWLNEWQEASSFFR